MYKLKCYLFTLESFFLLGILAVMILLAFLIQISVFIFTFPLCFKDKYYFYKLGNKISFKFVNFTAFCINPHWKCEALTDLPSRDPKNRVILMVNHVSLADAFVTTYLGKRFYSTFLYKDALHKLYPKPMLHMIGQVPIYFHYDKETKTKSIKKDCVIGVMERCKVLMENGFDLIVYPEGTRSKTGRLQEFKDGFFRFSIDNGYDIIPCGIVSKIFSRPLHFHFISTVNLSKIRWSGVNGGLTTPFLNLKLLILTLLKLILNKYTGGVPVASVRSSHGVTVHIKDPNSNRLCMFLRPQEGS
eukprot:XP_765234.1 hypothetical protein [Theileria parva strain Muguga]